MEIFKIENLNFKYPSVDKVVLNNINLSIEEGDFITICGMSGSGKSTLLRHLKPILTPHGEKTGTILYKGENIENIEFKSQISEIGYVMQNPDNQIVTDKVWHELAFGLESLGLDTQTIRLRVAEMANFFGIQNWFHKSVEELSGGQKQLLNLASIMAMQVETLILDEPTSQLDPIAAMDFLETIKKINSELGVTIIISEHRLEEVIPMSDKIIVMDKGSIIAQGNAPNVINSLKEQKSEIFVAMPSAIQIYSKIQSDKPCPITVRQGRKFLEEIIRQNNIKIDIEKENPNIKNKNTISKLFDFYTKKEDYLINIDEIYFKYEKNSNDVIKGLKLKIHKGEFIALLGGNGSGKTTLLSIIIGLQKAYRGRIKLKEKNLSFGLLPQNPQTLFVKKTVKLDLLEMLSDSCMSEDEKLKIIEKMMNLLHIQVYENFHPYDLSTGEQQRLALAKILLLNPDVLLLDEPTKGLDGHFKQEFADIIKKLTNEGKTIIAVSHDIEFCAKYADRSALIFDGDIITVQETKKFFLGNNFYTTVAGRISRRFFPDCITVDDVVEKLVNNYEN